MRLYAAKWRDDEPTACNCEWFTNKRDAEREASRNNGVVRVFDVPMTRAGLLTFLIKNLWRL